MLCSNDMNQPHGLGVSRGRTVQCMVRSRDSAGEESRLGSSLRPISFCSSQKCSLCSLAITFYDAELGPGVLMDGFNRAKIGKGKCTIWIGSRPFMYAEEGQLLYQLYLEHRISNAKSDTDQLRLQAAGNTRSSSLVNRRDIGGIDVVNEADDEDTEGEA